MKKEFKYPQTMEDVLLDPAKYGLPTFEQFCKSPDLYRESPENLFEVVDKGSKIFTKGLSRYTFEINGYKASSLEEVQKIALSEGLDFKQMDIKPMVIPGTFGESKIHVKFEAKRTLK